MLSPPPLAALIELLDSLPPALAAAVRGGHQTPEILVGMLGMLRHGRTPTVLVIDDAQWADGATLDLLRYLGRRIETTRALLVLSYRDEALAATHPLIGVLAGLSLASCVRLQLPPLSEAAVATLAGIAGRDPAGLHRATAGNPFFVTASLAAEAGSLPPSIREAVLGRVATLPPEACELLQLVSVAPVDLTFGVLDSLLNDVAPAAQACVAAGLLRADDEALSFCHELARSTIESSLAPAHGAALHAAVFDALSLQGAEPALLLHHAAHAGLSGAVRTLAPQAAAEAALASAHRESAALYALAVEHATACSAHDLVALLTAHAEQSMLANRDDDAMASRRRALGLHRLLGDTVGEAMDLLALARIEWHRGAPLAGQPYAQSAIDILDGLDATRELGMACATMPQLHLLGETSAPAAFWGLRALALLEPLDEVEGLAYALNTVGTAQLRSRDDPEAWARLQRSLELALRHGLEDHVARAHVNFVSLCLVHRRYAELDRHGGEGLAYCEAHDMDLYRCRLRVRYAYGLLERGRWDEAEAEIAAIRQTPGLAGLDDEQSAHVQALIELRRGSGRAEAYWSGMIDGRRALRVDPWFAPQAVARCEAAWLRGDLRRVIRLATDARDMAAASQEGWRIGQLATWLARAGGVEPAAARELPAPCRLELRGEHRAAAHAWAELGCPYEQAMALLGGDEADRREALASFDRMGAAPAARIARQRLHAIGARNVQRGVNRLTRVDPLGLTARERQVLDMLAEHLPNRAIAQRLHRSERTVEHHVAALLSKLGVRTRAEAAALVRTARK